MNKTAEKPVQRKIARLCIVMQGFIALSITIISGWIVVLWFAPIEWEIQIASYWSGDDLWQQSSLMGRIIAKTLLMLHGLLVMFALHQGWRLFTLYRRGAVFSEPAISSLRRLAISLLGLALLQPIMRSALSVVLTIDNPPGQRLFSISLDSNDLALVIFGGLLLVIAHIMVEAARIEMEIKHIV